MRTRARRIGAPKRESLFVWFRARSRPQVYLPGCAVHSVFWLNRRVYAR
jgi:hypothetical protein